MTPLTKAERKQLQDGYKALWKKKLRTDLSREEQGEAWNQIRCKRSILGLGHDQLLELERQAEIEAHTEAGKD